MSIVVAVSHVEAKEVHASLDQPRRDLRAAGSGAQGGDDLRPPALEQRRGPHAAPVGCCGRRRRHRHQEAMTMATASIGIASGGHVPLDEIG